MVTFLDAFVVGCTVLWLRSIFIYRRRTRGLPFPPGPKPMPIIGNVLDMPDSYEWETAMEWGKKYGDIVYVKNFGERTIFVNSYNAAIELFDKRGSIYNSRPRLVMCNELQGWGYMPSLMPYGDKQRKCRQILHQFLQPSAIHQYNQLVMREVHKMLLGILNKPGNYAQHIRHLSGAIILMVAYGHEVEPENDPYIDLAERGLVAVSQALGFFVVNFIPPLKHLPNWFPGASFKRLAKEGHALAMEILHKPYQMGKECVSKGIAYPSMLSGMLEAYTNENGEVADEELIEGCTSVTYAAGSDTTVSSNLTFVLAMLLYPEVQRRGQEELDRVLGRGNLPTFEDMERLPYVTAIYKEVLRWHPVTPFALPHCTLTDDFYNGYFIPADTMVLANVWAMSRDPKEYPKPNVFDPERYLAKVGQEPPLDPSKIAFGFGRRQCSGKALAELTIFTAIASLLVTFNIERAIGEDGELITPSGEYTSSIITHPKPFKCSFVPRSRDITTLIQRVVESEK